MGRQMCGAGLFQLVSGCNDGHFGPAGDFDLGDVGPGQGNHRAGRQSLADLQQGRALGKIAGAFADVARRSEPLAKPDPISLPLGIFLHHDAVGT